MGGTRSGRRVSIRGADVDGCFAYLQNLLVLLAMRMLHLLSSLDIILEVTTSMLVCLETLKEELGDLEASLSVNRPLSSVFLNRQVDCLTDCRRRSRFGLRRR